MSERDDAFLARWARRKREAAATPAPEASTEAATEAGRVPSEAAEPAGASGDAPAVELPDIESLERDSDYTAFLREGVPEGLRRAALRKLWRSDPVLANLDGLNDYDEDFRLAFADAVTKTVKTAYRAGKDWLEDQGEEAEKAPERRSAETPPAEAAEGDEPGDDETPPTA